MWWLFRHPVTYFAELQNILLCDMIIIYFNYREHIMLKIYIYLKTFSSVYMNAENITSNKPQLWKSWNNQVLSHLHTHNYISGNHNHVSSASFSVVVGASLEYVGPSRFILVQLPFQNVRDFSLYHFFLLSFFIAIVKNVFLDDLK